MSRLEKAEKLTKIDLTKTQRETGKYPKGRVRLKGIPIIIENPKDSLRKGFSDEGIFWQSQMLFSYGYIENSLTVDGDEIDIFLGPLAESKEDFNIYVIEQINPTTKLFDEYKVMFGFNNSLEAKKAYLSCYEKGWKGFSEIRELKLEKFINWIEKETKKFSNKKIKMVQEKIRKVINLEGEVIENQTLNNLKEQAGDLSLVSEIICTIASPGGDINEGIKIMIWFNHLSSLGIKVTTLVTANAYSIASLIMLAADRRLVARKSDGMVHNPMIAKLELANADELENYAKDLRMLENQMYEIYEIFTNVSRERIKELMDRETYLSSEELVELGFADEIIELKEREKVMAKINKPINMNNVLNTLNKVLATVSGLTFVNQKYYDAEGGELEIYQTDASHYKAGDRTSVKEGEVTLQDGSKLVIENYLIKDILKEVPMQTVEPVTEPVVESVVEPTTEESTQTVAEFNEGPAPDCEDDKEILDAIDASAEPAAEPVVEESVVEEPVVELTMETPAEMPVTRQEFDFLSQKVSELMAEVESYKLKDKDNTEFQELAAEAMDYLAKNISSDFKPKASVKGEQALQGKTIFQAARAKAMAIKNNKAS